MKRETINLFEIFFFFLKHPLPPPFCCVLVCLFVCYLPTNRLVKQTNRLKFVQCCVVGLNTRILSLHFQTDAKVAASSFSCLFCVGDQLKKKKQYTKNWVTQW